MCLIGMFGHEEDDYDELYADLYEYLEDGGQLPQTSLLQMEEEISQITEQSQEVQIEIDTLPNQGGDEVEVRQAASRPICLFMEDDDDELYADLYEHLEDGRQLPKTSLLQMEENICQITEQSEEMQIEIDTLQKQGGDAVEVRQAASKPICLFMEDKYGELYADLYEHLEDGRQLPKTSLLQMEEKISQITKQSQEMQIEIDTLQKQNDSLRQDKEVLIRNISCLFKTAQMEIARKNKQINELRKEISQLKTQELHPESLMPTEAKIKTKSEELLCKRYSNKGQDNGCREIRHADTLLEMDRLNPYDPKATKKESGDKNTHQKRSIEFDSNDKSHHAKERFSQLKTQEPHPKLLMPTEAQIKTKSEELLCNRYSNKVQDHGCRETRHADTLLEMDRLNPYDLKATKKESGNKSTHKKRLIEFDSNDKSHQYFRDARRQRIDEDERSSGGTLSKQETDSFNGHPENRREEISFRHVKRDCQSQEKLDQQGHNNGKDQQIIQHGKKDRVNNNEFRDHRTSGRRERDDRTNLRTATIRSMNENDIFLSDVSNKQEKDSFKGHRENRREEISFRHVKRDCQSQEQLDQQGHNNGKDQQIIQHGKKDRVNNNEFRDHRKSGRRERDDRTNLRTTTISSMKENDIFSSDVSCAAPINFGVKRKVADAVNTHKLDSYDDPFSYEVQKSNSFVHNRTDEKRSSHAEQREQERL